MKKEKYELSSQYMKDLKKLLKARKSTPYDIAHASFRKNNAYWIIKNFDKRSLEITYLNEDKKYFLSYNDLMEEIETVNREYKNSRKKHIKRYYDVIKEFGKLSGIPVILNTSFNEAGEPIVETPADAIRCFLKNHIDYLVVENYLITPIRD